MLIRAITGDILPTLMLRIQGGLLGSCTTIEGVPHFEKFLHLPVFPRLQQTCNPRSEPVRRQFVYSPRDRPPADFINTCLSLPFFLALARHHYSFKGDIFLDTQKEGWKNLVNNLSSIYLIRLFASWRHRASGEPGFHPDAQSKRLERGTSRRLVKPFCVGD
jgi:hypothetical protein